MAEVGNSNLSLAESTGNISSFVGFHVPDEHDVWVSQNDASNPQTTIKNGLVDSTFAASFALNMLALDVNSGSALYNLLDQLGIHYSCLRAPVNIIRKQTTAAYWIAESFLSIVTNKLLLRPVFDTILRSYIFSNDELNKSIYLDSDSAPKIKFYVVRRIGAGGSTAINDSLTIEDYTTLINLTKISQDKLDDYKAYNVSPTADRYKSIDFADNYENYNTQQLSYWSIAVNGYADCNLYFTFDEILLKEHNTSINYGSPAMIKQVKGLRLYAHCNSTDIPDMLIYQDEKFDMNIIEEPISNSTIDSFLVSNYQLSNSVVEYSGTQGTTETIFTLKSATVKDIAFNSERSSTAGTDLFDANTITTVTSTSKLKYADTPNHALLDTATSQLEGASTALYNCNMLINIGYVMSNVRAEAHLGILADIEIAVDVCNFGSIGHYPVHATKNFNVATHFTNYLPILDQQTSYYSLPIGKNIDTVTIDDLVKHYYYVLLPNEIEVTVSSEDNPNASFYRKFANVAKRERYPIIFPAGPISQTAVDITTEAYEKWINNNLDKSQYRTPMEYYNEYNGTQIIEDYDSEKLSNGTNSSTNIAPTYFWVESLKNWCTYRLNTVTEISCQEAELLVWNGLNQWIPLSNILAFYKNNYVPLERAKNLNLSDATDNDLFRRFNLIYAHKLAIYNFPVEQLHTIEIDRVYKTVEPQLQGQSTSWFESFGHGIMTGIRGIGHLFTGVFQTIVALPASLFTDKNAWEYTKDGWSDIFKSSVEVLEATYTMPLKYIIDQIVRLTGEANTNDAYYNIDFGKRLFARCFYVKLPYDSGYSSNDATSYQTIRVPKRTNKAYGAIDGGIKNRTSCAMYNIIPTTIGSPFATRSSSGELMLAYKMSYSGPIVEKYDSHEDLVKKSGITNVDIEFSNQLLRKTLGSGEDKTINDWLTTFADNFAEESSKSTDLNTTLASGAVEQHNQKDSAMATMKITATRSKTTSDVESAEINTLTKW